MNSINNRKSLAYRVCTNLAFLVLMAILAGVLLGHYFPATAVKMEIVGKTFVNIIKIFISIFDK